MSFQNRMMTLVAFLQAQNCSKPPGSWRHPLTMPDFLDPEYYQRIARTLEDGKIQMAFFDDRLALPDLYTGHHAEAIAAGVRAVKMDPSIADRGADHRRLSRRPHDNRVRRDDRARVRRLHPAAGPLSLGGFAPIPDLPTSPWNGDVR